MRPQLLIDLILFVTIAEKKSFTAAAKDFGLTKSIVSKHLSRPKKSLGLQLLRRSTRKLSLIEAGQLLYERCQHIKGDLEDENPRGTLRIGSTIGIHAVYPAIRHLAMKVRLFIDYWKV